MITTYRCCCLCLVLVLLPMLQAEEAPWPLQVHDLDTLILASGEPRLGTIEAVREDGSVVFTEAGSSGSIGYLKSQYQSYRYRRSASQVLDQRLTIFLDPDRDEGGPFEVIATLRWGVEQDDPAVLEAVKVWSQRAVKVLPEHQPLLDFALRLMVPGEDDAAIESIVRAGIAANPRWESGYNALLELLQRQGRDDDLQQAIAVTLEHRLNNHLANRLYADHALSRGAIAEAREAYRKASANNDTRSLLGYAMTSLLLREWNAAERSAEQLLAVGAETASATAILGSVKLHAGDHNSARDMLTEALDSEALADVLQTISRHNLGLIVFQSGDHERAHKLWAANDHPASHLAANIAAGRSAPDQQYAGYPALQGIAAEHGAALALADGASDDSVTGALDAAARSRHRFLEQVRLMLASNGDSVRVRTLALTDSAESRRWQLYGHLLAGRLNEAWSLANTLPDDDGYAAMAKVYIRAQEGEHDGAAALYRQFVQPLAEQARGQPQPDRNYVSVLAAEFDQAAGAYRRYDFNWPDGERLGAGWNHRLSPGSRQRLVVDNGQLHFHGGGEGASAGALRAWCQVRESLLERVILEAQYPDQRQVRAGLEILDATQRNGIAVTMDADRRLRWRQQREGQWQAWRDFQPTIIVPSGRHLTLLYRSPGRVQVPDADNQPVMVGEQFAASSHLSISIFADADAGDEWSFSAQRLDIGQRQR